MKYSIQSDNLESAETDLGFFETTWSKLQESFLNMFNKGVDMIPKLVVFFLIIIIGRIIAGILQKIVVKALKAVNLDGALEKMGMDVILNKIKPGLKASFIIGKVLFWLVMLAFLTAAADYMNLTFITSGVASFFAYLPVLLSAIILVFIGLYIADIVKNVVYTAANTIGVSGAKAIANIVYYLLAIVVVITGLGQAGMDTTMIETNLHLILGSVLLAFAFSYGFASREIVTNLLSSYYGKGKFKEGMKVKIKGVEGVIEKIDSISITINQGEKSTVFPSKNLIEEEIEIIN